MPNQDVEREPQIGDDVRHLGRSKLHHIGIDRIGIFARHAAIRSVGHRRVKLLPVAPHPVMQRAPEIVGAPAADSIIRVGRNVGRVNRAEPARHGEAARKWRTAGSRVTGRAIRGFGQVLAARNDVRGRVDNLHRTVGLAAQQVDRNEHADGDAGERAEPDHPTPQVARPAHTAARVRPGVFRIRSRTAS
jgi:hypothetical protein